MTNLLREVVDDDERASAAAMLDLFPELACYCPPAMVFAPLDMPVLGSLLLPSLALTLAAFVIIRFKLSVTAVLGISAGLGIGWRMMS